MFEVCFPLLKFEKWVLICQKHIMLSHSTHDIYGWLNRVIRHRWYKTYLLFAIVSFVLVLKRRVWISLMHTVRKSWVQWMVTVRWWLLCWLLKLITSAFSRFQKLMLHIFCIANLSDSILLCSCFVTAASFC